MKSRSTRGVLLAMLLCSATSIAYAQPPDPSLSTCIFPTSISSCPNEVQIHVQVVNNVGPMPNALVQILILVVAGSLDPQSPTYAEGRTDANGEVTIVFNGAVAGPATIFFEVYAKGIKISESDRLPVGTGCSIPVVPVSWGYLKRAFARL